MMHHRRGGAKAANDASRKHAGKNNPMNQFAATSPLLNAKPTSTTESDEETASMDKRQRPSSRIISSKYYWTAPRVILTTLLLLLIGVLFFFLFHGKSTISLSSLLGVSLFGSPVVMVIWVVVTAPYLHQRLIAFALVFAMFSHQLPVWMRNAIPAIGLIAFGIITRQLEQQQQQQQEQKNNIKPTPAVTKVDDDHVAAKNMHQFRLSPPLKAILSMLIMSTVLLVENFFIWVVSATFYPSHRLATAPPPLQDNGRILLSFVLENLLGLNKRNVISGRRWLNVQMGLVGALAAAFVTVELQLDQQQQQPTAATRLSQQQHDRHRHYQHHYRHRTLYTLAQRALLTLALTRFIRTISFLLTVLPSQVPNCYSQHYPNPPPADWYHWIQVGILPSARGGCNDLIISGHATVTSTLAWISCSVCHHRWFLTALWMLMAMDYAVEVYEGYHYSVDMWLGAILVSLIWHLLHVVEEGDEGRDEVEGIVATAVEGHSAGKDHKNHEVVTSDPVTPMSPVSTAPLDAAPYRITLTEMIRYSLPAMLAYLQITVLPESWVNYDIVAYLMVATTRVIYQGFDKYVQHILFCLLYLALGVYL